MNAIFITTAEGKIMQVEYGEEARCDNCGKEISKAKNVIVGGEICEEEWACCNDCEQEMIDRGCCFEELGNGVYRQQKY